MTDRDELIEAVIPALGLSYVRNPGYAQGRARRVLDAVEPMIRADERAQSARWKAEATEVMREWERVWEALGSPGRLGESKAAAALALLEGGSA